jgi:hypothetical protein
MYKDCEKKSDSSKGIEEVVGKFTLKVIKRQKNHQAQVPKILYGTFNPSENSCLRQA